jgi:hypothetical protein
LETTVILTSHKDSTMTYTLGTTTYKSIRQIVDSGKSVVDEHLVTKRLQEQWKLVDAISTPAHQKGKHIYDEHRAIALYLTGRYTRAELSDICGMCPRSVTHILEKYHVFA